jgi:hypothetical protein
VQDLPGLERQRGSFANGNYRAPPLFGGPGRREASSLGAFKFRSTWGRTQVMTFEAPIDPQEAIAGFLEWVDTGQAVKSVSSLMAAIRDARQTSGRDQDTGEPLESERHRWGNWLGALGYMVALDLIGDCFIRTGDSPVRTRKGIQGALETWAPHLDERQREALYSLRCCFAHDYALLNVPSTKPDLRSHRFQLVSDGSGPVVTAPAWGPTGSWRDVVNREPTRVDLQAFSGLCEFILTTLRTRNKGGDVTIRLADGIQELYGRYSFYVFA